MAVQTQLIQPQMIYVHKETPNSSFIDMHHYLKSIGIQNNDFFLALLDPGLAGVDPRDPNLPQHMKARILYECQRNYWYFLREVVRIPVQGGDVNSGNRYRLHRGNLAMNFLFVLNFNQFVEMPRQNGKTVGAVCRYLWCFNFGTTNSSMMFIHKDHSGSKNNLKTLKEIRDALPSYLKMDSATNNEGKKLKVPNTVVMMQHPYNNNKITTFPSARTKEAANNLGRGATMPLQFYDEFAFMPYNQLVYEAATPAFSTASQNAKMNNAPYGILVTTTPGDLLTDAGKFAYNMRNNATPWNEQWYDKTYAELEEIKKSNTNSDFFLVSFSYKQLGRDAEYFRTQVIQLQKNWVAIRREILLEWAEIAEDCAFSAEDLDIIKSYCKEPIRTMQFGRFGQYTFNIYEDIDTNYPPIIGVDVSGAARRDSSAITVVDSKTTRVGAAFNCNYIPQDDLADLIYELVSKYLPNAIINIERNGGYGSSVVNRLLKTSVKKNLYWEEKEKIFEEVYNGVHVSKSKQRCKVYGLDSNREVRARLIEILYGRVELHKDKFICPILHQEMQSMQVKKNGKVEHSDNSHDDQVFSYLMALYVWYDGKNLMENFHLQKNTIRTDQDIELEEEAFEDRIESHERVDVESAMYEPESDILQTLKEVEDLKKNFRTTTMVHEETYLKESKLRDAILSSNEGARKSYAKQTGLEESMLITPGMNGMYVDLPDSIFGNGVADDEMFNMNIPMTTDNYRVPLQGNLSKFWSNV